MNIHSYFDRGDAVCQVNEKMVCRSGLYASESVNQHLGLIHGATRTDRQLATTWETNRTTSEELKLSLPAIRHKGYNRSMNIDRDEMRKRLARLDPARLADALVYLSYKIDGGTEFVESMLLPPEEAVKRFKSRLSGLKRRRKFIDWRSAAEFSLELELLIASLRASVSDPKTGLDLISQFFECDRKILERCDDSSGMVGDVFNFDARDAFISYASQCTDKTYVSNLLLRLYEHDDYGTRTGLVTHASEFLSQAEMRALLDDFWERAKAEQPGSYAAHHWWIGVELLARQLRDPELFEKAVLAAHPTLSSTTCMEIANVYLENDDLEMALFWMKRIPKTDRFRADDQDELLYTIYEKLGNREKMAETAWRLFNNERSSSRLNLLLRALGEDKREQLIKEQVESILNSTTFSYDDARFLVEVGRLDDASEYLLLHHEEINGDLYQFLLPLAKALEEGGRFLGASVIYRALLESILARAQTRYYHHGVRYLKKLDTLSTSIEDWRGISPHSQYKKAIQAEHKRKRSFWSRYEG